MGLDTSHDCWHGPYSAFHAFRGAIAEAAGPLRGVKVDRGGYAPTKEYPQRCYYGWWDIDFPYTDVLEVLFIHSDCQGWIFPQDGELLAERLEGIIEKVEVRWQPLVREFIDGLRLAADRWEVVVFR